MARTYGKAFRGGFNGQAYLAFLQARLARVYPLYALATVIVLFLTVAVSSKYPVHPVRALWTNLLLVQNLGAGLLCSDCSERLVAPGWSISTEAAAYLLFPALAAPALFGRRTAAAWLLGICALVVVLLACLPFDWLHASGRRGPLDMSEGETLWPLARCLVEFSIGLVVWRVAEATPARQFASGRIDGALTAGIVAAWFVPNADVLLVAMFAVLIWRLATGDTWLTRALSMRVPYQAGLWSYAIYLLHLPALQAMSLVLPSAKAAHIPHAWTLTLGAMAVLTIVLAAAAHRTIEKPARQALRGFFHRGRMPIVLEPSAP